jgi:glycosyltransferase involved in cell wall biosynthesis
MKIIHYSLGFFPYRTGGLTRYAEDLAKEQAKEHIVAMLWPGEIKLFTREIKIKKKKSVDNVLNYEIINPLPVTVTGGIKEPELFFKNVEVKVDAYKQFLADIKPDVIHIHTFMGLHKQFLLLAQEANIKLIYTAHDYFGICPQIVLFKNNSICETKDCIECSECNANAPSYKQLFAMQHPIYRLLKNTSIFKIIRKYKKQNLHRVKINEDKRELYQKLRKHYIELFSMINQFHFNSEQTKNVYMKYMNLNKFNTFPVTHKYIKDNRRKKNFKDRLKIIFLGKPEVYKGFYMLKDVLNEIDSIKFKFTIFKEYSYNDFEDIFSNNDLLIVPSVWLETFGLVVLEALSYGVPVLATNCVGASYLLKNGCGIICEANKDSLKEKILEVIENREILSKINENILMANFIPNWKNYLKQIEMFYE